MIHWRSQLDQDLYTNILIPVLQHRPTTVFVGAGLSYHAGYPLLDELINTLCSKAQQHTGEQVALADDWKQQAQICKNQLGQANFEQALIDIFDPDRQKLNFTSLHTSLIQTRFKSIITTNYDSCIELAYRELGKAIVPFYYPGLSALELGNGSVQHIHGYIDPDEPHGTVGSVVLTSDDFLEAYRDRPGGLRAFLTELFSKHNVIFIGFNMNDEVLTDVLSVVQDVRREKQRIVEMRRLPAETETTHFAILANHAPIEVDLSRDVWVDPEEFRRKEDRAICLQDATLQSLGVLPIRYKPDEYHKSVENIIGHMRSVTNTLSPHASEAGDIE